MTMQSGQDLGAQIQTPTSPLPPSGEPQTTPAGTGAPAPGAGAINLFELPEFRQFQAQADRQIAEARNAAKQAQDAMVQLQADRDQRELETIDALDPEEQVKALKRRLGQQTRQAEQQRVSQQYITQAGEILQAAGLTWQDPRIQSVLAGGPTPETVASLGRMVAMIAQQDAATKIAATELAMKKQMADFQAQMQTATTRERQDALKEAGVPMTSGAPSVVAPRDERADKVDGFRKRRAALARSGINNTNPQFMTFLNDLRAAGLTLADVK